MNGRGGQQRSWLVVSTISYAGFPKIQSSIDSHILVSRTDDRNKNSQRKNKGNDKSNYFKSYPKIITLETLNPTQVTMKITANIANNRVILSKTSTKRCKSTHSSTSIDRALFIILSTNDRSFWEIPERIVTLCDSLLFPK